MKAFVIHSPHMTQIADMAAPILDDPDQVLLEIKTVGICGTDLHIFRGSNPLVSYPRIPGHEVGAVIVDVGSNVSDKFQPGMKVTLSPLKTCGACSACRQNRPNCCATNETLGVQRDGALVQFLAAPWQALFYSEKLSFAELALVEPLTIGFHAVDRGRISANDTVAVLGSGTIGLTAIAGAKQRNATVIAVDVDSRKLETAKKIGADQIVNASADDLHEQLQAFTNGCGPNVIIEAVGASATYCQAVQEVAYGGRVVYVGWAPERVTYDTKDFLLKELDILGSRNSVSADYETVIRFLEEGLFPVEEVISQRVALEEMGHALARWSEEPGAMTKIQIQF